MKLAIAAEKRIDLLVGGSEGARSSQPAVNVFRARSWLRTRRMGEPKAFAVAMPGPTAARTRPTKVAGHGVRGFMVVRRAHGPLRRTPSQPWACFEHGAGSALAEWGSLRLLPWRCLDLLPPAHGPPRWLGMYWGGPWPYRWPQLHVRRLNRPFYTTCQARKLTFPPFWGPCATHGQLERSWA